MNWKEYEKSVLDYFETRFPNANISKNVLLKGKLSKTNREIDILIESHFLGVSILIAVECKNWNSKLDVSHVGTFIDKLKDVGITKGVMISKLGYSESAHNRAKSELEVQLQVIDFENIPEFYGFWGNPYRGHLGAIISAPNGWVVDKKIDERLRMNLVCYLHPFEFNSEESIKRKQFMYFQIFPNIDDMDLHKTLKDQDDNVFLKDPNAQISYWKEKLNNGRPGTVQYRKIEYKNEDYTEFTAGVTTDDFYAYCVYSVSNDYIPDDLARLKYVMGELHLLKLNDGDPNNSHEAWEALLNMNDADNIN